jgi:hypothetical protein
MTYDQLQEPEQSTSAVTMSDSPNVTKPVTERSRGLHEPREKEHSHQRILICRRVAPSACRPSGSRLLARTRTALSTFVGCLSASEIGRTARAQAARGAGSKQAAADNLGAVSGPGWGWARC